MRFKASINEASTADPVMLFTMHLLHSATNAHILHWTRTGVGSDAAHRALGDFYETMPDLLDKFVESFQGKYGLLHDFIADYKLPVDNPVAYIESLATEVESLRRQPKFPQDSELQNEVDTIANLINKTLYRLKNLK